MKWQGIFATAFILIASGCCHIPYTGSLDYLKPELRDNSDKAGDRQACPPQPSSARKYAAPCPIVPAGVATDSRGCPIPLSLKEFLHYETNHSAPPQNAAEALTRIGALLAENPLSHAVIEGHTDDTGGIEPNRALSLRRAEAIKQTLVSRYGIAPQRIKAVGLGKSMPLVPNRTEEGRSRNRRVEITLSGYYKATEAKKAQPLETAVYFTTGRIELTPQALDRLAAMGDFLRLHPAAVVRIEGHTDDQGARLQNLALSQQRAEAVKRHLMRSFGLPEARLRTMGYGSDLPLAPHSSEEGRRENRRVEVRLE